MGDKLFDDSATKLACTASNCDSARTHVSFVFSEKNRAVNLALRYNLGW